MTSILRRAGLRTVALLMAAWAVTPLGASAQDFPVRPVRFIVPFPPGGPVDTVARALAQKVSEYWAQAVLVESRADAGGIVGAEPAPGSTAEFGAFVRAEKAKWARVIKAANIKPD